MCNHQWTRAFCTLFILTLIGGYSLQAKTAHAQTCEASCYSIDLISTENREATCDGEGSTLFTYRIVVNHDLDGINCQDISHTDLWDTGYGAELVSASVDGNNIPSCGEDGEPCYEVLPDGDPSADIEDPVFKFEVGQEQDSEILYTVELPGKWISGLGSAYIKSALCVNAYDVLVPVADDSCVTPGDGDGDGDGDLGGDGDGDGDGDLGGDGDGDGDSTVRPQGISPQGINSIEENAPGTPFSLLEGSGTGCSLNGPSHVKDFGIGVLALLLLALPLRRLSFSRSTKS